MDMQAPVLAHQISKKQRVLLMIVGGLIGLLAIITLGVVFFGRSSSEPYVTKVILQQRELLRVNELANDFQPNLAIRHLQSTIAAAITSDMAAMQEFPNNADDSEAAKTGSSEYLDSDAKNRFTNAAQRNAFEREYRATLTDHLVRNRTTLTELRDNTKSNQLKDQAILFIDHVSFLLDMVPID